VSIGNPRFEGWEIVSTFEDQTTALAWRDQLRGMGLDAKCVADRPLDAKRAAGLSLLTTVRVVSIIRRASASATTTRAC
jgi:hypothetical protein